MLHLDTVFKKVPIRPKGLAALGLVVVICASMLTVVLVMATLSVLPMHMAAQHLAAVQARLVSEAALEEFKYWYYSEQMSTMAVNGLCVAKSSKPIKVQFRFNKLTDVFPPPTALSYHGTSTCLISFRHGDTPYYSVNNTQGDSPVAGCSANGSAHTVPSHGLDLVINVTNSGGDFRYEALMTRSWPYAVFCLGGIVLADNVTVCGDVGITKSLWAATKGSALNNRITIGGGLCCCAGGIYCGDKPYPGTVGVGGMVGGFTFFPISCLFTIGAVPCSPGPATVNGNAVVLYTRSCMCMPGTAPKCCRVVVYPPPCGNLNGYKEKKVLPYGVPLVCPTTGTLDIGFPHLCGVSCVCPVVQASASPVKYMRKWKDQDALYMGVCPCPTKMPKLSKPACLYYLSQNMLVGGVPPSPSCPCGCACVCPSNTTNYYFKGNLVNYVATPCVHPSGWTYSNAGISIQDALLVVDGNVDLLSNNPSATPSGSAAPCPSSPCPSSGSPATVTPSPPPPNGLVGNNATLIVKGTLRIQDGQISSGDGNFVILADNLAIEAGGTFDGLMVARRYLRLESEPCQPLDIVGGVLAKGSDTTAQHHAGKIVYKTKMLKHALTITGTSVKWQGSYVKGLNALAELSLVTWRLLP